MYLDRMDYLYDEALRTYCELEKKEAAGLSEGDLEKMLRFANAAAYLVTTRKGAIRSMPEREQVEALLERM